jgi:hypothetical protein
MKETVTKQLKTTEVREFFVIRKELIDQVIENLVMYYTIRGISNAFIRKVTLKLTSGSFLTTIDQQEMLQLISYIVRHSGGWAAIIDNPDGQILRLNREIPIATVKENIARSFKESQGPCELTYVN